MGTWSRYRTFEDFERQELWTADLSARPLPVLDDECGWDRPLGPAPQVEDDDDEGLDGIEVIDEFDEDDDAVGLMF